MLGVEYELPEHAPCMHYPNHATVLSVYNTQFVFHPVVHGIRHITVAKHYTNTEHTRSTILTLNTAPKVYQHRAGNINGQI